MILSSFLGEYWAYRFHSWLYALHLALDANFRLKLKDRGLVDPEFGPGWAYFVNEEKYKEEIAKHTDVIEVCP